MTISFPDESAEYRRARIRLLEQEIELRRATDAVAQARRDLPAGGLVPEDYRFEDLHEEGRPLEVRLSGLFADDIDSLVVYISCAALVDQLEGAAPHANQQPGQESRHVGMIEPLWNLFDLTPEGRPDDWDEQLGYCCAASTGDTP